MTTPPPGPPKPPRRTCRTPGCDNEPYPANKDWGTWCREHAKACEFVPAHEPFSCRVHHGIRTRLDATVCSHVNLASKVAAASPAEPPTIAALRAAHVQTISYGYEENRCSCGWDSDTDPTRGFDDHVFDMVAAASPAPALDERAAEQRVIAAARDLNATMPDTGDGDPLQDLDDALLALDAALGTAPEAGSREP